MALLHNLDGLLALATALMGLLIFGFAPKLVFFPPALMRLFGCCLICAALAPILVITESWAITALVGGGCLIAVIVIHLVQTQPPRRKDEQ